MVFGSCKNHRHDVLGREISFELVEFTSKELRIEVLSQDIGSIKEKFEVITIIDFIEHTMDPKELVM